MQILIYSYNYAPEPIGIAPLMTELAEGLVKRGHEVRVVTGMPNYPERQIYEKYRGLLYCTEVENHVVIQRSYLWVRPKPSLLDRILLEASFVTTSFIHSLNGKRPDVILMTAPPLPVSVPAAFLAWIHSCPIVLNLQDILPDAAIHVGLLKENSKLAAIFRFLEKFGYQSATKISVIADGFIKNLEEKGVSKEKIELIPNWVNVNVIKNLPKEPNTFRDRHGLNGKFVVMYSGNIALTQGIETVIHAAVRLRHVTEIVIVIVGEEQALKDLEKEEELALKQLDRNAKKAIKKLHLQEKNALKILRMYRDTCKATNVKLLPFEHRKTLPQMLAAADVGLVLQKKNVINFNMPSKIPLLMASSRVILASVPPDGTAASAIRESGSGILIPPEDPKALAAAIQDLYTDPNKAEKLGEKGRKYAEENYAFEKALDRYEKLFATLTQS